MNAVVAAFNQEKALVGAFSVITNLRMELFQAVGGRGMMYGAIHPTLSRETGLVTMIIMAHQIFIV